MSDKLKRATAKKNTLKKSNEELTMDRFKNCMQKIMDLAALVLTRALIVINWYAQYMIMVYSLGIVLDGRFGQNKNF